VALPWPTEAIIRQRGKDVFRIALVSADFDTPVAAKHVLIPAADSTEQLILPR
jgi:hypothetical protein